MRGFRIARTRIRTRIRIRIRASASASARATTDSLGLGGPPNMVVPRVPVVPAHHEDALHPLATGATGSSTRCTRGRADDLRITLRGVPAKVQKICGSLCEVPEGMRMICGSLCEVPAGAQMPVQSTQ